jgi:hypothetical protein
MKAVSRVFLPHPVTKEEVSVPVFESFPITKPDLFFMIDVETKGYSKIPDVITPSTVFKRVSGKLYMSSGEMFPDVYQIILRRQGTSEALVSQVVSCVM